jgi:hypothetical protein
MHSKPKRRRFLVRSRVTIEFDSVCEDDTRQDAAETARARAEDLCTRLNIGDALADLSTWCEAPPGWTGPGKPRLVAKGPPDEGEVLAELDEPWLRVQFVEAKDEPGRSRSLLLSQPDEITLSDADLDVLRGRIQDLLWDEDAVAAPVVLDMETFCGFICCVKLDRSVPTAPAEAVVRRLCRWPHQLEVRNNALLDTPLSEPGNGGQG